MLVERRKSKRLDICIIVEYKALESSMPSLGITRDFASDGFSIESQDFDVEPGENLDFRFKNAESNVYVSAAGAIVWKKRNREFGYLIGIRFNEIDDETRKQMYEAVSATGHIPLNDLTDNNGYDEEYGDASDSDDYASMYYAPDVTDEEVDEEQAIQESTQQEVAMLEDQLTMDVVDDMNAGQQTETGRASIAGTFPVKIDRRKKKPLYAPIIKVIVLLLLLLAAILLFGEQDKVPESRPVQIVEGPVIVEEMVIVEEIETRPPAQPVVYVETHTVNAELPEAPFLVQVGAWKNPEYSNEILPRLQEHYPDAYIVVENDFNIIRIPGVMNREQGWIMLEEIADNFNLTALVITNK